MTGRPMWRWQTIVIAMLMATAGLVTDVLRADDASAADVASFLTLREIDRSARSAIEAATEWNDAADAVVVKVLERLAAPAVLVSGWREAASSSSRWSVPRSRTGRPRKLSGIPRSSPNETSRGGCPSAPTAPRDRSVLKISCQAA